MTEDDDWVTVASVGGVTLLQRGNTHALTTGGLKSGDRDFVYASEQTLRRLADEVAKQREEESNADTQ